MSRSDLLNSPNTILASPNSASVLFGIDAFQNARPKGLFFIRFRRPYFAGGENWNNTFGFLAKSVDQPSVTPQIEEVNQYGKKRIIHTGIKYNPISITFYDTVNNRAASLWNEYSRYYFGDFTHADSSAWSDDITASSITDPEKSGFGFTAQSGTSGSPDSLNTQFFFEALEIYQVYGDTYTQTDIINPKIGSYEPESVDYEDMSPIMLRMTLSYEAIQYRNSGRPALISNNEILSDVFSHEFSGEVFNPPLGVTQQQPYQTAGAGGAPQDALGSIIDLLFNGQTPMPSLDNSIAATPGVDAAYTPFGSFSYGNGIYTPSGPIGSSNGRLPTRESNAGESLFDTDDMVTSVIAGTNPSNQDVGLDDFSLGIANAYSDGTVQIGRRDTGMQWI